MPKSYEPCYTKTNKSGGKYTTCEGSQKKRKAKAKLKKGGEKPPLVKKKGNSNPQGFGNKFIFGQSPAVRKAQGRINTGTLNPANPNLSVNPWGTTSEIQAQTYQVNTDLFFEGLGVMAELGKEKKQEQEDLLKQQISALSDADLKKIMKRFASDPKYNHITNDRVFKSQMKDALKGDKQDREIFIDFYIHRPDSIQKEFSRTYSDFLPITFDDLYNSKYDLNYFNDWIDEGGMTFAKVKSATNKLLRAYDKTTKSPNKGRAMDYVKQNA